MSINQLNRSVLTHINKQEAIQFLSWQSVDCRRQSDLSNYSRCMLRDDVSTQLNFVYSFLFLVFFIALLMTLHNLFKLFNLSIKQPRVMTFRAINICILLALISRLVFYFDSIVILLTDWFLPLKYYIILDSLSILSLDTSMVIGAYCWMLSLLTISFKNKLKPYVRCLNYMLVGFNCLDFLALTLIFSLGGYNDEDPPILRNYLLPSILLVIPTLISGFYFSLVCVLMCIYLQNRGNRPRRLCLDQLGLVCGIVSFLRVGQSSLEITVDWIQQIRTHSLMNDDLILPMFTIVYVLIVEFFPIIPDAYQISI